MPVASMRILRINYPKKKIHFFALEYLDFVCQIYKPEADELFYMKMEEIGFYKLEEFFQTGLVIVYSNCFVSNGMEFTTKQIIL